MRQHTRVLMIIPSRGRPAAAAEAARSAIRNSTLPTTTALLAVDGPEDADAYRAAAEGRIGVSVGRTHQGMVATLNSHARLIVGGANELYLDHRAHCACPGGTCMRITHVGFMGDDHRVRTRGWDAALAEAAGWWGVAYGDDLLQGEELPTAVLMAADIVRITGHMAPGVLRHLYVDDYWKALGQQLGALAYVPGVVIEHLHPSAGKAELDDSYLETNHPDRYAADRAAWDSYRADGPMAEEVAAVRAHADRQRWLGVTWLPNDPEEEM